MMKLLFLIFALAFTTASADEPASAPVGMRTELRDLIIPGPELEAKPLEPGSPVVARIITARVHGDSFRYDIDYYGLEAGVFDLVDYLQTKDGSPKHELATAPVIFIATLAPDRITPNEPEPGSVPSVGGYKTLLVVFGILWFAGLLFLILFRRRESISVEQADAPPATYADRLRPLVESARDGKLDEAGQAELERTLLGFWREKLDLSGESPVTAMAKLRQDKEAAPLLKQLERWLHSPESGNKPDIDALLKPYAKHTST
jgi:hypothetical protein